MEINETIARRVLEVVDAGLSSGLGEPRPGNMCVEAAVCYALDLPHSDDPQCISPALRRFKIRSNDSIWSSKKARANGMRRLAVIQLGSKGFLDENEFTIRLAELAIRKAVPIALRAAANLQKNTNYKSALLLAADRCENEGTRESANSARKIAVAADYAAADYATAVVAYAVVAADDAAAADYAAAAAASAYSYAAAAYTTQNPDQTLSEFCEDVVQILIDMKVPGAQWLWLTNNP